MTHRFLISKILIEENISFLCLCTFQLVYLHGIQQKHTSQTSPTQALDVLTCHQLPYAQRKYKQTNK